MTAVVLSVDAELAWGFHDSSEVPERRAVASETWERLLDLLDEFDVPATWAIVGHLFIRECDGEHEDHATPTDDWFDDDPGGSAASAPPWFGDGLVEAVADADAGHEIGGHTFSHVAFGDERTTRDVAIAETRASVEAADDAGFSLQSFVFPGNDVGHRDVLAAYGFTCYRGTRPALWYDDAILRSVAKTVDLTVSGTTPPLVEPTVDDHGLVNVPASMYLFGFEGWPRTVLERSWADPMLRAAKRGIDRAADEEGVFHLWLHPSDLVAERDFRRLRAVLEHVDAVREATDLAVRTMGEVAADLRPEDPVTERTPIGPR
ncbi:polysaccharide deacetylase family protein [Halomicrococcus sp. NG-SE-24]|uniref:polysaccharide deacetylase family protein n=1 Tax=Halomicrococcus sp. NG-SE-24 TaxID=3436928 RepID=UPI003D98677A